MMANCSKNSPFCPGRMMSRSAEGPCVSQRVAAAKPISASAVTRGRTRTGPPLWDRVAQRLLSPCRGRHARPAHRQRAGCLDGLHSTGQQPPCDDVAEQCKKQAEGDPSG